MHRFEDESELELTPEKETDLTPLNFEQLLEKAGGFGKFQWLMLLFALFSYQGMTFFIYGIAFLELMPQFLCKSGSSFAPCPVSQICNQNLPKSEWKIDYGHSESLHNWMTDLQLFCEPDYMIGLLGSMYFIGFAVNGVFLKQADRFGRRKMIIIGSWFQCITTFGLYFARNLYALYVLMFIAGVLYAKNLVFYVLMMEIVPSHTRVLVAAYLPSVDVSVAIFTISLYFYLGGLYWDQIMIVALVLSCIVVVISLFVPESPKYLYAKGMFKELRVNLGQIARINKTDMGDYLIEVEQQVKINNDIKRLNETNQIVSDITLETPLLEKKQVKKFRVIDALKQSPNLLNLICVVVCFTVVSFNYYMINFYMKYVGGNIFINTMTSTASEIVGNFAAGFIQRKFGTKKTFIVFYFFAFACAIPLLFTKNAVLITFSVFTSKFFITGAFTLSYFVNSEIFNPLFVPFAISTCGLVSRVFTVAAPQIAEIKPRQVPIIFFLVMTGVATVFASMLRKPKEM